MIEKRSKEVFTVYGYDFMNLADAEAFKSKVDSLLRMRYYIITYKPDLTEGRGYYGKMKVGVPDNLTSNLIYQFIHKNIGKPLAMVQGVSPINNWILSGSSKFESIKELMVFLEGEEGTKVGDYYYDNKDNLFWSDLVGDKDLKAREIYETFLKHGSV